MAYVIDKELLNKPKEKYWVSYIKQRIRKNKNFLGFISGQTGSGKSYSTIRICEELDPTFNIDQCVFNGLELMNLINSGKLKKGSCIAFEEVGVELSNKNWASQTNKLLNYLLQTFRHRGFILIMNTVYMDFVDSATRKLFHGEFETKGIDFNKKEVLLKPLLLQYNGRNQKFYRKRLKVITSEGKLPVDFWRVPKPTEELRVAYEKKKRDYTDTLNKRIYDELYEAQHKGEKKKELTDNQQDVLDCLKRGLNVKQIATLKGKNKRGITEVMNYIRKKGYKLDPVFEGITNRNIKYYEVTEPDNKEN